MNQDISSLLEKRISSFVALANNDDSYPRLKIINMANEIISTLKSGKKVALIGNGGSAAEAMHIAAEFTGKCVFDHRPLSVMCLNESQSSITAIANDYGIEQVFSRQVEAHLRSGDLLIALSTSGRSPNILNAISQAKQINVKVLLWMGNFETEIDGIDIWKVPSTETPRIQEIHLLWGHILAEIIEVLI